MFRQTREVGHLSIVSACNSCRAAGRGLGVAGRTPRSSAFCSSRQEAQARIAKRSHWTCLPGAALSIGLSALMLAGCMVGPDFPAARRAARGPLHRERRCRLKRRRAAATGGAAQRLRAAGGDLPAQWWSLYRSEPLDRLIRDRTRERVRRWPPRARRCAGRRENLTAQTGALLYRGVDANASRSHAREDLPNCRVRAAHGSSPIFNLARNASDQRLVRARRLRRQPASAGVPASAGATIKLSALRARTSRDQQHRDGEHPRSRARTDRVDAGN